MSWIHDLRYAFRSLLRRPGLTATSVASLAIGLGGTLAIFAVAYGVLFRPLPFADPDRLLQVRTMVQRDQLEPRAFSVPDLRDYRAGTTSVFTDMAALSSFTMTVRATGVGVPTSSAMVGATYFSLLGVSPLVGSVWPERDDADDTPPILISEGLWERHFNRDPQVVGRTLYGDDQAFIVSGVMPATFRGTSGTVEAWVPFARHPFLVTDASWNNRGNRGFGAIARLAPGVSLEAANAALTAVGAQLAEAYPVSNKGYTAQARLLSEALYGTVRPQLVILLAAVGVILFMTCVNVANLLVARLSARQFEFAVRSSLGATRGRIVSLAAADGFALALMGAVAATPLVWWLVALLRRLDPASLPTFAVPEVSAPVLLVGAGLTMAAAGFITLASIASVRSGQSGLSSSRGASDSSRTVRLRQALTTVQVACAVALLTTAVLLGLSFRNLSEVEAGYRTSQTFVASIELPNSRYEPARRLTVIRDLHTRLPTLPGVQAASVSVDAMLGGGSSASFYTADVAHAEPAQREGRVYVHQVSDDFFRAAGIALIDGASVPAFDGQPVSMAEPDVPVVVSQRLAARFWSGQSAVGQRIKLGRSDSPRPWMRIVGVVADTKFRGLPDNPTQDPDLYLPFAVRPTSTIWLVMHTTVPPASLTGTVQQAVAALDPQVPLTVSYDIAERVALATAPQRFLSQLSAAFGLVALLLAVVGTYGVVAYQVVLSQRAIGIRLALGAVPRQIFAGVIGGTARLLAVGLVAGAGLAVWAASQVAGELYRVTGTNVPVIATAAVVVSVVALAAAWLPARRAMRVNPVAVLRGDA